jgi:hypothetical protein
MMAVTAGMDSRVLLAESRGPGTGSVINDQANEPPDRSAQENLRRPRHSISRPRRRGSCRRGVSRVFCQHVFCPERILPTIYHVYFKSHSDKVNLLGIGEIGRTRFGKEPRTLDGYRIAYKMGHKEGRYALRQGGRILDELEPVGRAAGLNVLTLLYWEHWLGNWGATGNSESDIAIEEIDPYDSHGL